MGAISARRAGQDPASRARPGGWMFTLTADNSPRHRQAVRQPPNALPSPPRSDLESKPLHQEHAQANQPRPQPASSSAPCQNCIPAESALRQCNEPALPVILSRSLSENSPTGCIRSVRHSLHGRGPMRGIRFSGSPNESRIVQRTSHGRWRFLARAMTRARNDICGSVASRQCLQ